MPKEKRLVVSDLTHTIYLAMGTQKENGLFITSGKKEDFTNQAISAVFSWFVGNLKENESAYEIRYKGEPFVLKIEREEK